MQPESKTRKPEIEEREAEATSKETLQDLDDDEETADLTNRRPVPSPDGSLDQDEELEGT